MRVVAYRLRRVLGASLASTMAMVAVVAIVVAIVLAIAAGASRTSTAPDRYSQTSGLRADVEVQQQSGAPRTAEIGQLPSVASMSSMTFVFGGQGPVKGSRKDLGDALTFAGSINVAGERLVQGRLPRAGHDGEFVASRSLVDEHHLVLGDHFQLVTLTNEQAEANGFTLSNPADAKGPKLESTLVGVVDGPGQLDDSNRAVFFPSSLLKLNPGISATIVHIVLRPGYTLSRFKDQLDALPNSDVFVTQKAQVISSEVRVAVRGQSEGLWMVAVAAGLAAVVAISQLIVRQVRASGAEQSTLNAIGMTRGQATLGMVAHGTVLIAAGCLLGVVLATVPSGVFPVSFVRRIEPSPGFRIETVVLLLGGAVLGVGLLAGVAIALALRARPAVMAARSPLATITKRLPSGAISTGVRFACTPQSGDGTTIRGAVVGMIVGVAVLVGAFGFGASLDRLVDQPARWGANYDVAVGGNGVSSLPKTILADVKRNTSATGITFYGTGQTRVGGTSLQLVGMRSVRGAILPPVLEGHDPAGPNELALGRLTARTLHAHVGSQLRLDSKGHVTRFRVTGIVVVPGVDGVDGVGLDGVVTLDSLAALRGVPASKAADSVVVAVPGKFSFAQQLAIYRSLGGDPGTASQSQGNQKSLIFDPPASIVNLERIRAVPYLLAGVLALLVLLTVVHVVTTSVYRRSRDVAVLRALGSGGRWILGAQCWQAVALVAVPIVVGLPVGLLAGTRVFHLFADSIGTVDAATASVLVTGVIAGGTVVVAVLAAMVTRGARRGAPAAVLRSE